MKSPIENIIQVEEQRTDLKGICVNIRSEAIVAKTRKLKAVWTPEFAQDLNAYQNLDAEAYLTSVLGDYIEMEIDLDILDMLIQSAPTTKYWSAQGDWFQSLGTKTHKVDGSNNWGSNGPRKRNTDFKSQIKSLRTKNI